MSLTTSKANSRPLISKIVKGRSDPFFPTFLYGKNEDVINAALAQHGGINKLIHGDGDDQEIPEDVFTNE